MAFPTGWNRRCIITVQQSLVPANQTAFPVLITEACLPTEMVTTGGTNAAQSDGGDIRFTTDTAGSNRLACEIVIWSQNATPANARAEIWVPVDILGATDVDIYVWYKAGGSEAQPAANAAFGSQAVWDSNFKGIWHLPNGSSLSAAESTSNGNNGTIVGSLPATAGKIDGGASGQSDPTKYISTSYVPPTSDFTYSCWANPPIGVNINNRPFGTADAVAGLTGASLLLGWKPGDGGGGGSDSIYCIFRQGSNVGTGDILYTPAGLTGGFLHFAIRMASVTGASLVINGVQVATNNAYTSITLGGLTFTIGKDPNQTSGGFSTVIDEVRVSDTVRTADWLLTEYNSQVTPGSFAIPGTPVNVGGSVGGGPYYYLMGGRGNV